MSALAERAMILHLLDGESLEVLVREGITSHLLPTPELHPVYDWAISYYAASGAAPTLAAMMEEWGDLLRDWEVIEGTPDPEECWAEESIDWTVSRLRATFIRGQATKVQKDFAKDLSESATDDVGAVLAHYASEFVALSLLVESRRNVINAREGLVDRMVAYDERTVDPEPQGLQFGWPVVDDYTHGIHPGELAVLGAPAKAGKSMFLTQVALNEWLRGQNVALFTLENSVEMTLDRIACLAAHVSYRDWQRGRLTHEETEEVRTLVTELSATDSALWVVQPPRGQRSAEHMVREAQVRDCDAIILDQLTFVEPPDSRLKRDLQIRDIMHTLASALRSGPHSVPCLLAHQINREGTKAAEKRGRFQMTDMAEGSEVERTADWVFALYQSAEQRVVKDANLQTLASRREDLNHFLMSWNPGDGYIQANSQISLDQT